MVYRRLVVIGLLGLSLLAGCSFSAGISRGQELESDLMPSVLQDHPNMISVFESTVRIRAKDARGSVIWLGSGNVFKKEDGRLSILSNSHVCSNTKGTITVQFILGGKQTKEYLARVDVCVEDNGVDVAVISLPHGTALADVPAIPILDRKLSAGDKIFHVGCDGGQPQNAQIGEILEVSKDHFLFWPSAYPGDSGSSIVQFDKDGEAHIVGLVAWQTGLDGRVVGMAMKSRVVLEVLAGGAIPPLPEGEAPPSTLETDRLIQGLLQRLQELRRDAKREREGLLNRLSQMQLERAAEAQQTQLFRDRWKKQQEEQIEEQSGLADKMMGQFNTLKQLINLAKLSFYALVAALLVSIFAGQGWLTRVIVTIFKVLFNILRGSFTIIADAIAKPIKKTNSPSEALDNLREEIGDAFDDDPAS